MQATPNMAMIPLLKHFPKSWLITLLVEDLKYLKGYSVTAVPAIKI